MPESIPGASAYFIYACYIMIWVYLILFAFLHSCIPAHSLTNAACKILFIAVAFSCQVEPPVANLANLKN